MDNDNAEFITQPIFGLPPQKATSKSTLQTPLIKIKVLNFYFTPPRFDRLIDLHHGWMKKVSFKTQKVYGD